MGHSEPSKSATKQILQEFTNLEIKKPLVHYIIEMKVECCTSEELYNYQLLIAHLWCLTFN